MKQWEFSGIFSRLGRRSPRRTTRLKHFEKYRSHHDGIVAAVSNRQASF
jgi:hypothetical protein